MIPSAGSASCTQELGIIDLALFVAKQQYFALGEVAGGQHRAGRTALAQRQHVSRAPALGRARRSGSCRPSAGSLAAVAHEEQAESCVGGDEEVIRLVLVL